MNLSAQHLSVSTRSKSTDLPAQPEAEPDLEVDQPSLPLSGNSSSGSVIRLIGAQARQQYSAAIDSAPSDSQPQASTDDIDSLVTAFSERFAATAQDPQAFHTLMRESFGSSYDQQTAEALRQRALAGDFSWLPRIEVVDASVLVDQSGTQGPGQGMGAYDAANDRILLNRDLLSGDPNAALDVLTEEIGHGLDARLNSRDTAGDEGAVFSRLSSGDTLGASELAALRAENDSGTINVNGQNVEVEFWFGNDLVDSARDVVSDIGDAVSDGIESIGDTISDGVQWVGDTISDGVDAVYEYGLQPLLQHTGPLGELLDDHLVRPAVGWINDGIDIFTNTVDSLVDTGTHFLSNTVQTSSHLIQGDLPGFWNSLVQTGSDFFSDTTGAIVENFAMGLHAVTSLTNGVLGLSETRGLNELEIAYLQTIYGDSLDYSEIRIQQGGIESWNLINMDPHTVGSDIYLPDNNFTSDGTLTPAGLELLSHEAAHAWQFQNNGAGYLSDAIGTYIGSGDPYDYGAALENLTPWENLTPDQQAEFAMLIGMAQVIDGIGPIKQNGIDAAIQNDRGSEMPAFPALSADQLTYLRAIQQRLLAGNA